MRPAAAPRIKTCLPSADDHLGAMARSGRSLPCGVTMKFDLVLLTRIFVGSLLGYAIGWEREAAAARPATGHSGW
jgi:hypothetical protein